MGPTRSLLVVVMASLALTSPGVHADGPSHEQTDQPITLHAEPRWLKGNLHTHSLWSDGNDYPEMIVDGWIPEKSYAAIASSPSEGCSCSVGGLISTPEFNSATMS